MARQYSAFAVRCLKTFGEVRIGTPSSLFAGSDVGKIQRFGGAQGSPVAFFSFSCGNKPVAMFRRLMSSLEEIHDSKTLQRVAGKDRLILRGCTFQGYHGVMDEEKTLGQKFVVDMDAWLDLKGAGESDNLEHSVSYVDVFSAIQKVVEGPSHHLIESVANDIACSVMKSHPQITDVRLRIYKPMAPIAGFFDKIGIEIHRTSSDFVSKS